MFPVSVLRATGETGKETRVDLLMCKKDTVGVLLPAGERKKSLKIYSLVLGSVDPKKKKARSPSSFWNYIIYTGKIKEVARREHVIKPKKHGSCLCGTGRVASHACSC